MKGFKEKFFKGITYTAALFTIVFLFGIIGSIFYEGSPIITSDLGPLQVHGTTHEFPRPWEVKQYYEEINELYEGEIDGAAESLLLTRRLNIVKGYFEVYIDGVAAETGDEVAAFSGRECRGISEIVNEDGYAYCDIDIYYNPAAGEEEVVHFAVYDKSAEAVYEVSTTQAISKGKVIGESDYREYLETGSPVIHPRRWHLAGEYEEKTRVWFRVDGEMFSIDEGDELAAFIGEECRGIGEVQQHYGSGLVELEIGSESAGEMVHFSYFSALQNRVIGVSKTIYTDPGETLGSKEEPIDMTVSVIGWTGPYEYRRPWHIEKKRRSTSAFLALRSEDIELEGGDEIGFFVEKDCRGVGKIMQSGNQILSSFPIYSDEIDTLSVVLWDNSAQKEILLKVISESDASGEVKGVILRTSPGEELGSEVSPLWVNVTQSEREMESYHQRPWRANNTRQVTKAYIDVEIDSTTAEAGDEIGVFMHGECRGRGNLEIKDGEAQAEIDVYGDDSDMIRFAIYRKSSGKVVPVDMVSHTNPGGIAGYPHGKPKLFQAFGRIGDFVGGLIWHPTQEPGEFGILSLILGSLLATLGALILAIPFGIGSAIYISEIARPRIREIIKPIIELLAGIPSVVYGLFGMAFLSPALIKLFNIDTGLNLFNASIILGVMVIPIISSMSEDALSSVPKSLRQASYGLGANRWETITRVVLPAAKTGVIGSILLGFGRAIGETMVVIMVAGGSPQVPSSIFDPIRPMTSAIASEMGETAHGTLHFHALFGIAVVLFIITFVTNLISEFVFYKQKHR